MSQMLQTQIDMACSDDSLDCRPGAPRYCDDPLLLSARIVDREPCEPSLKDSHEPIPLFVGQNTGLYIPCVGTVMIVQRERV